MTVYEQNEIAAHRLGRLEAESFNASLRERERCEREERLMRLAVGDEAAFQPAHELFPEPGRADVSWRLRQDVQRLAAFHLAVLHSRAWRLIQAMRRVVGRAW